MATHHSWSASGRRIVRRFGITVSMALAIAACSPAPNPESDPKQEPADPDGEAIGGELGTQQEELKTTATLNNNLNQFFLGGTTCDNSQNIETATVVIPPDPASPHCPNGRAFAAFNNGWLQQVDLDGLTSPAGRATQRRIDTIPGWPTLTIPTRACTTGCCNTTVAKAYTQGGDVSLTRTGPRSLLIVAAAAHRMTRNATQTICNPSPQAACAPELSNAVNISMVSNDCGTTWTGQVALETGDGQNHPLTPGGLCGNADFSRLHVDPYKTAPSTGKNYVYMIGGSGFLCCGGVDKQLLYRSVDGGVTFQQRAEIPWNAGPMGLTSYPDGTTAIFGCTGNARPRITWSYGTDDATWNSFDAGPEFPPCATTTYTGGLLHLGPDWSSMSRVLDQSFGVQNFFRFVYQTVTGSFNTAVTGYGSIPQFGSTLSVARMVKVGTVPTIDSQSDILHGSFIDPDQFDGGGSMSDTSVLFWQEGRSGNRWTTRYEVVTGLANYTAPLALSGLNTHPLTPSSNGWAGEFDRGSYWKDRSSTAWMNVLNYFPVWDQTHPGCPTPNAYLHYNRVRVVEPRFLWAPAMQASKNLAHVTATKVMSGGEMTAHILATENGTNHVYRSIYQPSHWPDRPSDTFTPWGLIGTAIGTSIQTTKPPAAASWSSGRLDAVVVSGDSEIWHYAEQNGVPQVPGGGWESLGNADGGFIEGPAITSVTPSQLFVAAVGSSRNVFYKTFKNGGWSGWLPLPARQLKGAISAISPVAGRIDVFGRGTNDTLNQYTVTGSGNANWEGAGTWTTSSVPGKLSGSPAAIVRDSGRLDVFAGDGIHPYLANPFDSVGQSQIMHLWWENWSGANLWSKWHTVGGILKADTASSFGSFGVVAITPLRAVIFTANQRESGLLVGRQLKPLFSEQPFDANGGRAYTASGDWAPSQFKGECADTHAVVGVSASKTSARGHSLLCMNAGLPMKMYPPAGIVLDISASSMRSTGISAVAWGTAIDWDAGHYKGQCSITEVITGVSQTTAGRIAKIRCTPMEPGTTIAAGGCYPRIFSAADNRGSTESDEWAAGFWRGECAAGEVAVGLSANTSTGAAHAIQCCNVARLP
jgi:hypothetical protein